MKLSDKARKFYEQHYGQLIGFTVIGIGIDDEDETIEAEFCLVMKKGNQTLNVFISQDEEGNGPGFLEIEQNRNGVQNEF